MVTICGEQLQKEGKRFKYTHSIDIFKYEGIWIYIATYLCAYVIAYHFNSKGYYPSQTIVDRQWCQA